MSPRNVWESDFWHRLDGLRSRQFSLVDVAQAACESGVPVDVALDTMERFHMLPGNSQSGQSLREFVGVLGRGVGVQRVLEVNENGSLLSRQLLNSAPGVCYLSKNAEFAEAAQVLLGSENFNAIREAGDLPAGGGFDLIIAQLPFGVHRPGAPPDADGFGGELVKDLLSQLSDNGLLIWVAVRGLLWNPKGQRRLASIVGAGWAIAALLDLPRGSLPGATTEGVALALRRVAQDKKLVGALRDEDSARAIGEAFVRGPERNPPPICAWLNHDDRRTFSDLERERQLRSLFPRGRYTLTPLSSLLSFESVTRADKPITLEEAGSSYLFVPEYVEGRVSAELDQQTVKPERVYRLCLDGSKVDSAFLAFLFNSEFGKALRQSVARGAAILRVSRDEFLNLQVPLPDLAAQRRFVRVQSDIGVLRAALAEHQTRAERDWTAIEDTSEIINNLKSVLDIDRRIAEWWRELPYPLATIYRRYRVASDPRDRLEALLHFFEVTAVYLSAVGLTHLRVLRSDSADILGGLLHPARAAGIDRADFGFWINLCLATFKELNRTLSAPELRGAATDFAGPEILSVAGLIAPLGDAAQALNRPRGIRNSWIGHGGHIKSTDAQKLEEDLQASIRELYGATVAIFRRLLLVRPGKLEFGEGAFVYDCEGLVGSDPTFEQSVIELNRPVKSRALAFWYSGARVMCTAVPFFRIGAPQNPQETTIYVYNRAEKQGFRWVSYQEVKDQEIIVADDEMRSLVQPASVKPAL